jgi:hypothetical protein
MKIGEALRTQASSLYSATPIGAPMHPAPIGVADRTRKKNYWRTVPGLIANWQRGTSVRQYIGALIHRPQSRQSARLSLQSSELGPQPLNPQVSVSPPLVPGGDTLACRRGVGWGPNIGGQTKKI